MIIAQTFQNEFVDFFLEINGFIATVLIDGDVVTFLILNAIAFNILVIIFPQSIATLLAN